MGGRDKTEYKCQVSGQQPADGDKMGIGFALTRSGEGDAEVCDGQQLRRVDAVSSQQLHKIS